MTKKFFVGALVLLTIYLWTPSKAAFPVDTQKEQRGAPASSIDAETTASAPPAGPSATTTKAAKKAKPGLLQRVRMAKGRIQLVALLLALFGGVIGLHRFYLGYKWQGIVQLLTLGGLGIWALIDFVRICTGDLQPKNDEYEKTL